MDTSNLHYRLMLQHYEAQLLVARRLSRYRRARIMQAGYTPPDPKRQRKAVVNRVARELYGMIISTGSDNPIVETITEKLSLALGVRVILTYLAPMPFKEEHLRIMRLNAAEGALEASQKPPIPLTQAEHLKALHVLWKVTLEAVEENMV